MALTEQRKIIFLHLATNLYCRRSHLICKLMCSSGIFICGTGILDLEAKKPQALANIVPLISVDFSTLLTHSTYFDSFSSLYPFSLPTATQPPPSAFTGHYLISFPKYLARWLVPSPTRLGKLSHIATQSCLLFCGPVSLG